MAQKGFAGILILILIITALLASGIYFFTNKGKKESAAESSIRPLVQNDPQKPDHLLIYTEEEIFGYEAGKQAVRNKSVVFYNPETNEKKILLSDDTKQISYSIFDISPDKTKLLMGKSIRESGRGRVFTIPEREIFDLDSMTSQILDLPEILAKAVYTSDLTDKIIYFVSEEGEKIIISKYDWASKEASEIVRIPQSKIKYYPDWRDFAFSPDKTKLLFAIFGMASPASISFIDFASGEVIELTKEDSDTSPKWLDSSNIIFQRRDRNGNDSVWRADVTTKKEEMLLGQAEGIDSNTAFRYTFAINGNKIIYPSLLNEPSQDIVLLDLSSKQKKALFSLNLNDFTNAKVTSDYKFLAFSSLNNSQEPNKAIYLYNLENKTLQKVCENLCGDFLIE